MFYKIINFYCRNYSFPKRGLKYFISLLKKTNNYNKVYFKKLHNGLQFRTNPSEHIQQQIFWYGFYEKDVILLIEKIIKQNSNFIDVGANAGYISICASKYANNVFAFEPCAENVTEMSKNIKLNLINNIKVVPNALSNSAGNAIFYYSKNENSGMGGLSEPTNFSGIISTVKTVVLDEWATENNVKDVSVVKIDIEGAELNALNGMTNLIAQNLPVVIIEINNTLLRRFNNTVSDIYSFFNKLNYAAYEIVSGKIIKKLTREIEGDSIVFISISKFNSLSEEIAF